MDNRRELKRAYREAPKPAGLLAVRNTVSGRVYLVSSPNLPGMTNRQRFQLDFGSHPNKELQGDWNTLGEEAFAFEVLDEIDPGDDSPADLAANLEELREMWVARLAGEGVALYGKFGG